MPNYKHVNLSTSDHGRVIPVAATATPGTLIHTAVEGDADIDEMYLYVSNVSAVTAKLTIEWGGVLDPGDHLVKSMSVPANSPPIRVVEGQALNGTKEVRAFSTVANALNISGFAYRQQ